MLYRQYYLSPIGRLSLVASEESLYGIWLEGQNHFQSGVNEAELVDASNPVLKKTKHWLEAYFKGDNPSPDILPLADRGTDFQQKVWSVLGEIPYGRTISYGQISQQISCKSAQAVGTAVGKNPWLIIVPCHRVLPSSGHIGKYAAGEDAKRFLLHLEGITFDNP
ncbi:MAG: methylated-DNA--[protein]-cysteine S-methyltransferase [Streptococcus sp.]|uniref:methylated-DNA--[protein]-cysteine S-methyltransferase n=1 Tax=Streptococcus salivarius TaxID=1304 RepID=UPI0022E52F67|nr:methylated-DNA--[protein]-cysteine S-methyltransferase [Streptococcus salivarius]